MMKHAFLLFSLFCLGVTTSVAQQSDDQTVDQYFAMIYTVGENWDTLKAVNEQAYFSTHSKHLSALRKEKRIVMGGRYDDKGFMLLKASSLTEAKSIVKRDSSVLFKTFQVELYPFNAFYKGCVD